MFKVVLFHGREHNINSPKRFRLARTRRTRVVTEVETSEEFKPERMQNPFPMTVHVIR